MGAWNMAKPIEIPDKPIFKVRLIEGVVEVGKSRILEMRKSKDTGNIFVRFVDAQGKEFIGLRI
jgi:hypothetical protein